MRERYEGNWKYLNMLQYPFDDKEIESYNYTVLAIRDTVKQLMICDSLSNAAPNFHTNQFSMMMNKLNEFKQLNKLDIRNHTNSPLTELDSMLDKCVQLEDLSITLHPIDLASEPFSQETSQVNVKKLKPMKSVKQLTLNMLLNSQDALPYVMYKFPNAKHLNINYFYVFSQLGVEQEPKPFYTTEFLRAFSAYLQQMESVHIDDIQAQNLLDVVRCLQANANEIRLVVDVLFEEEFTGSSIDTLGIKLGFKPVPRMNYVSKIGNHSLNFLNILRETANVLTSLKIECSKLDEPDFISQDMDFRHLYYGYFLDDIFTSCPKLKSLTLNDTTLMKLNPEAGINHSIETVKFFLVRFDLHVLFQLSVRLPVLKYLTIDIWSNCGSEGQHIPDSNNHYFVDMPYTSFNTFSFLDEHRRYSDQFFMRLCTTKGEKYYIGSRDRLAESDYRVYNEAKVVKSLLSFDIRCRSIKKIGVYVSTIYVLHEIT
ncbi:uncharacterized protein B0P05DRAFT_525806 [Gilbertella persicaria]|uniref:uncharacterized protein n=1 Tax=Gilbertella persicaria TaxID=101096 RepID=UPI00221EBB74|nr:uncharacterized protein B0P05DRAFT_525806 [Gilbertella persicaria]KAI8092325.1 hypothetical protein B0P05DRAFT_525806 [Gilbertella persicaria]